MASDLRRLSLANLHDAVRVMNGSSSGHTFEFGLDFAHFLMLSRFWGFSYDHSYLGYVRAEAAGVVLNTVDADSREAYSFYWGVLPEFRKGRISMALAHTYLNQVRKEGYRRTYADVSADSPVAIYTKLGFRPFAELIELRTDKPRPLKASRLNIRREVTMEALLEMAAFPNEGVYWTRRPFFLGSAATFLEVLCTEDGPGPPGFAVLTRWPGHTIVLQLEGSGEALDGLLAELASEEYPKPIVAAYQVPGSTAHGALQAAGFAQPRTFVSMVLEF